MPSSDDPKVVAGMADLRQNLDAAQQALQMTPQERVLYERHLANLLGPGKVEHPGGGISTLYQMNVTGPDGQAYNIPSVYDGQIVSPDKAIQRAGQYGWNFFPSYPTPEAAEARYQQMHGYMDQDVGKYRAIVNAMMQQKRGKR